MKQIRGVLELQGSLFLCKENEEIKVFTQNVVITVNPSVAHQ